MAKFQIGDRVRLVGVSVRGPSTGAVGTVLEIDESPFVAWDDWHGGHGGGANTGDNVWAVEEDALELLEAAR